MDVQISKSVGSEYFFYKYLCRYFANYFAKCATNSFRNMNAIGIIWLILYSLIEIDIDIEALRKCGDRISNTMLPIAF